MLLVLIMPTTCKTNKKTIFANGTNPISVPARTYEPTSFINNIDTLDIFGNKKYQNRSLDIRTEKVESLKSPAKKRDKKDKSVIDRKGIKKVVSLSGVNEKIIEALNDYTGPEIKITSALRHSGYRKSLHRVGKAIDIHMNEYFAM